VTGVVSFKETVVEVHGIFASPVEATAVRLPKLLLTGAAGCYFELGRFPVSWAGQTAGLRKRNEENTNIAKRTRKFLLFMVSYLQKFCFYIPKTIQKRKPPS